MIDDLSVDEIVAKMAELADLDPIEIPPKIAIQFKAPEVRLTNEPFDIVGLGFDGAIEFIRTELAVAVLMEDQTDFTAALDDITFEYDRIMDTFLMGNNDAKDTAQINRNSGRKTDNGERMAGIDLAQPDPFAPEILPSLRPGIDF